MNTEPGQPSVRGAERADILMGHSVDQRASGGSFSVENWLPQEITDFTLSDMVANQKGSKEKPKSLLGTSDSQKSLTTGFLVHCLFPSK